MWTLFTCTSILSAIFIVCAYVHHFIHSFVPLISFTRYPQLTPWMMYFYLSIHPPLKSKIPHVYFNIASLCSMSCPAILLSYVISCLSATCKLRKSEEPRERTNPFFISAPESTQV